MTSLLTEAVVHRQYKSNTNLKMWNRSWLKNSNEIISTSNSLRKYRKYCTVNILISFKALKSRIIRNYRCILRIWRNVFKKAVITVSYLLCRLCTRRIILLPPVLWSIGRLKSEKSFDFVSKLCYINCFYYDLNLRLFLLIFLFI